MIPDLAPLLLSPTLATSFLGCRAAAAWTLEARRGLRSHPEAVEDPHADLIIRKGHEHEAACLAVLRERHGPGVTVERGDPRTTTAATAEAMQRGEPLVIQAALGDARWHGYADFLVRVSEPCPSWAWSYEPWDAKLARSARPEHVLQIALYGDLLGTVQGRPAANGALMLGTGDAAAPFAVEHFRLDDVRHYVRRAAFRLEAFAANLPPLLEPEPCGHCGKCGWSGACTARWEAADHLSLVANISRRQTARLVAAGVPTLAALARLAGARVAGISPDTLSRLSQQARLQRESAARDAGIHELLPAEPSRGLARLPLPDAGDLFFDFEGDPMAPGGLEYLCGVLWRALPGDREGNPVPDRPGLRFWAVWAHDRFEEKRAFTTLMSFLTRRLAASPGAHLYHYAPYEKTALRRLASMHAVAEAAVDDLLRSERTVDLYRVVREAVRVGEPSYSIKSLERFYMPARATAVTSGGDSLVIYDQFRQTGEASFLHAIRDYNRDDCLSTLLLRDWLVSVGSAAGQWPAVSPPASPEPETDKAPASREVREEREREQAQLETAVAGDPKAPDAVARQLMADLVGFHRREAKPAWWAFFDRSERSNEELCDDDECLGGLEADSNDWIGREKRSLLFHYRFPEQETKLREGDAVYVAATRERAGTIFALDEAARIVTLKRGAQAGDMPRTVSLMPGGPVGTDVLREAVWAVAADIAKGGQIFPHIAELLRRDPPRIKGRSPSAPIVASHEADDPARLLVAAKGAVAMLDRSWLVIQGPPGAGKTFTTAHLIAALVRDGRTVGVASNSHKAIDNVLHAVEARLHEAGEPPRRLGQKKGGESYMGLGYVVGVEDNGDVDPSAPILAGTAWLFARPELRATRDVLFVDEAGQVSLGNLVAMATAARSVVLVGDQMQLSQPIQGSHPRDSGASALDHLLEGHAVVPPERGVFLSRTWRMHPDLCDFVSAAVYEGKLRAEPGCANQGLVLERNAHPALKPVGLSFVPVAHAGCRQRSDEEAREVRTILDSLLQQRVADRYGQRRSMTLDDVLIVSPYNLQVNLIRATLPEGARVGTVDKFQGQEAEVVIVSMATSGAEDMPRDAAFLLSRNRFNVAISRARCFAILVASPGLLDIVASSVEEMRLANLFCWAEAVSRAG